jgi:hypothetical protein
MTASATRDFTSLTNAGDGTAGRRVRIDAKRFVGKTNTLQNRALGLHHPSKRQWQNANSLSLRAQLRQLTRDWEFIKNTISAPVTRVDE